MNTFQVAISFVSRITTHIICFTCKSMVYNSIIGFTWHFTMSKRYYQLHTSLYHVNMVLSGIISFTWEFPMYARYYQFHSRNSFALVNYDTVVCMNSYLTCQKGIISFTVAISLH
jgi:hypothetical protein